MTSLLDYIEDNWRDSYRPFTRYPEIYGEHLEQGKGLLTEEGQGWSSLYKKPLGLLNVSGIPALYEAFRDEPIRDNLINAGMDSDKAGYATQAIGTALDIGVPWAVMKKGMTPYISEAVKKTANVSFDPTKRKLIKGAAGATALAATGKGMELLPAGKVVKQAVKSTADLFTASRIGASKAIEKATSYPLWTKLVKNRDFSLRNILIDMGAKDTPKKEWREFTGRDLTKAENTKVREAWDRIELPDDWDDFSGEGFYEEVKSTISDQSLVARAENIYSSDPAKFRKLLDKQIKDLRKTISRDKRQPGQRLYYGRDLETDLKSALELKASL